MGNISKKEFQKAVSQLRQQGLSMQDIKDLKNATSGHFDSGSASSILGSTDSKSISKKELETMIKDLREHPSQHHLSKEQINKTEKELKEDLND